MAFASYGIGLRDRASPSHVGRVSGTGSRLSRTVESRHAFTGSAEIRTSWCAPATVARVRDIDETSRSVDGTLRQ